MIIWVKGNMLVLTFNVMVSQPSLYYGTVHKLCQRPNGREGREGLANADKLWPRRKGVLSKCWEPLTGMIPVLPSMSGLWDSGLKSDVNESYAPNMVLFCLKSPILVWFSPFLLPSNWKIYLNYLLKMELHSIKLSASKFTFHNLVQVWFSI